MSEKIPETLEEAVEQIFANSPSDELTEFARRGHIAYHHGFGTGIRNGWGLWANSDLAKHFKARFGLGHADDMSGMILEAVECKIKGVEFAAEAKARYYQNYWRDQGIDPLTQKKL